MLYERVRIADTVEKLFTPTRFMLETQAISEQMKRSAMDFNRLDDVNKFVTHTSHASAMEALRGFAEVPLPIQDFAKSLTVKNPFSNYDAIWTAISSIGGLVAEANIDTGRFASSFEVNNAFAASLKNLAATSFEARGVFSGISPDNSLFSRINEVGAVSAHVQQRLGYLDQPFLSDALRIAEHHRLFLRESFVQLGTNYSALWQDLSHGQRLISDLDWAVIQASPVELYQATRLA